MVEVQLHLVEAKGALCHIVPLSLCCVVSGTKQLFLLPRNHQRSNNQCGDSLVTSLSQEMYSMVMLWDDWRLSYIDGPFPLSTPHA